ncbi:MucR family transcriptional regulator [Microvirga sp. BT688]|uniref:MucR family transcriptional regulator n=1 Tax=Microvirga sp. TaxID=1873136 RepID=UPI00168898ED|nr:MucR family transcriptional regulator [Microvirga sp.]MBD2745972.1 MucR family transcriptional regulator [Microvirga sp.]
MTTTATSADVSSDDLLQMTANVVTAYVTNNSMVRQDIPTLIENVHKVFASIQNGPQEIKAAEPLQPRLPIKKTITPDYLISLEDGRQYRTLKRHLRTAGLTPDEYRAKWGLPADYPMVAASYSEQRSQMAKTIGLGVMRKKTAAKAVKKNAGRRSTAASA